MKHILVAIFTLFILLLMGYTYEQGRAFHGGEAGKVVEDIKTFEDKKNSFAQPIDDDNDGLKALKDKAGNIGKFKVSKLYRSKCASCHGINGDGIIGPKLYGQTTKDIYTKMVEYKTGRRESPVMQGILISVDDTQLKQLSEEIGQFKMAK